MRTINSQAWSRYSIKKPRKNYIKAMPHTSLLIFKMGKENENYDTKVYLTSNQNVQLRSNALEAARQAVNKYLEREMVGQFDLRLKTYPHHVIREKKMATGAGADRISKGMTLVFGKPSSVAARVYVDQPVFEVTTYLSKRAIIHEGLKRAASKLSGTYKIKFVPIQKQQAGSAPAATN